MSINYLEIGRRIAERRHSLGLRQAQVCEKCEINNNYLSNIEHAKSIPSLDVFLRICEALNTTPNALLLGTKTNDSQNLQTQASERIKGLSERQISLLLAFLDWLSTQNM